jgi:hypothetical protein
MSQRYIGGLIYNPPGGYSGYFDGSGDYLTTPANSAFTLGTGDYTLELWVFLTAVSREHALFDFRANASASGSHYITTSDKIGIWNGSSLVGGTGSSVPANTWSHIAYVRSSGSVTAYLNGVAQWTASYADNLTNNVAYVCGSFNGLNTLQGYASNARIVKGTAVYTTAFTPPNGPLQNITNTSLLTCRYPTFVDGSNNAFTITVNGNTTVSTQNPFPLTTLPNPAQGGAGNGIFSMSQYQSLKQQNLWPAIDPYFDYTTLLLHGNGTNGAQNNTFLDSSSNNFTITRNGNTTQGTFSPFSQTGWSNYFDGSGDYLQSTLTGQTFGTGDFTVEFWVKFDSIANTVLLDTRVSGDSSSTWAVQIYNSNLSWEGSGVANLSIPTSQLQLSTWTHFAYTRISGVMRVYMNGVQYGSTASVTNNYTSTRLDIGGAVFASVSWLSGYMSNVRLVKGSAVYTGNFTPPTDPLTAISGTVFLSCQSNRFVDNSSSAFAISVGGTPSVQAFSPFQPTAAYDPAANIGSVALLATGDYLQTPTSSNLTIGTGAFQIDFWMYPTEVPNRFCGPLGTNNAGIFLSYRWSSFGLDFTNNTDTAGAISAAPYPTVNSWHHVTLVRNSSGVRSYYIDGVRIGSLSNAVDFNQTQFTIGTYSATFGSWPGYIADFRIIVGSNVVDPNATSITVPTAPLPTPAGTQLHCKFTNAGIIDSTAKNDLVTVGNAQISTAQSKFGGASMYFDGTGDYLQNRLTDLTNFGTGDFTMECWIYPTASGSLRAIVDTRGTDINAAYGWFLSASDKLDFLYKGSSPFRLTSSGSVSTNTWTHVAVCRASGTLRLFINGNIDGSATVTDSLNGAAGTRIGGGYADGSGNPGFYLTGYIDDLRITKGIARYTSNFTPQTSQWQDQ